MRRSTLIHLEAALARLATLDLGQGSVGDGLPTSLEQAVGEVQRLLLDGDVMRRLLQAALEAVTPGVVVCDVQGEEQYRNPAADHLLGGRLGGLLAEQVVTEMLDRACRGEAGEQSIDLFAPARRGLLIRTAPLRDNGRLLGAVAVVDDVTERQLTDAIRRDFVANVSHELKTPIGALSLLAETLDGEKDAEVIGRLATRIGAEAQRLGRLVDNLLDLGRLEGDAVGATEVLSLDVLVREGIDPLRPAAARLGVGLQLVDPPAPIAVAGVRRDLASAVANLVDNAVKYSERGGSVRVTVGTEGRWALVAVADDGIGIPARDLERVFERFYRVDRARARTTGGTGLGLSLVRHVAVNHGGWVEVDSVEGEGSTFVLRIPRAGLAERPGVPCG